MSIELNWRVIAGSILLAGGAIGVVVIFWPVVWRFLKSMYSGGRRQDGSESTDRVKDLIRAYVRQVIDATGDSCPPRIRLSYIESVMSVGEVMAAEISRLESRSGIPEPQHSGDAEPSSVE